MSQSNVIIEGKEKLMQGFFDIDLITLRHKLHSGEWSETMARYLLHRPDAVCAFVHNTESDSCYFVRQFRVGAYVKEYGWLTELAAGLVDEGETPLEACRREVREELGFDSTDIQPMTVFFASPAIISERIHLYYVKVTNADKVEDYEQLQDLHEDIDILEVPVDSLNTFLYSHPIRDAKTMIGLLIFTHYFGSPESGGRILP